MVSVFFWFSFHWKRREGRGLKRGVFEVWGWVEEGRKGGGREEGEGGGGGRGEGRKERSGVGRLRERGLRIFCLEVWVRKGGGEVKTRCRWKVA